MPIMLLDQSNAMGQNKPSHWARSHCLVFLLWTFDSIWIFIFSICPTSRVFFLSLQSSILAWTSTRDFPFDKFQFPSFHCYHMIFSLVLHKKKLILCSITIFLLTFIPSILYNPSFHLSFYNPSLTFHLSYYNPTFHLSFYNPSFHLSFL